MIRRFSKIKFLWLVLIFNVFYLYSDEVSADNYTAGNEHIAVSSASKENDASFSLNSSDDSDSSPSSSSSSRSAVAVMAESAEEKTKSGARTQFNHFNNDETPVYSAHVTEWKSKSRSTENNFQYKQPYGSQIPESGEWKSVILGSSRRVQNVDLPSEDEIVAQQIMTSKVEAKARVASKEAVRVVSVLRECGKLTTDYNDALVIRDLACKESAYLNDELQKTKYEIEQILFEGDGLIFGGSGKYRGLQSPEDAEKINRIIDRFEVQITYWKTYQALIYRDVEVDNRSTSPKYPEYKAYKPKWDKKVSSHPYNQDLYKVVELCREKKFTEAELIVKTYEANYPRTKDGWTKASPEYTQYLQVRNIYSKALNAHKREMEARRALAAQAQKVAPPVENKVVSNKAKTSNRNKTSDDYSYLTEDVVERSIKQQCAYLAREVPRNVAVGMERLIDEDELQGFYKADDPRVVNRMTAFQESIDKPAFVTRGYQLTDRAKNLLRERGIKENLFATCYGNEVQHAVHTELVSLVDSSAALYYQSDEASEARDLSVHIVNFAEIGVGYNKIGHVDKAMTLTDLGWALLDCGVAVAEGVVQGVENIINSVLHPINTAINLAEATKTAGYYLGKALHFVYTADEMFADRMDFEKYDKQRLERAEQLFAVAKAIEHKIKSTPPREMIKEGTALVVETVLASKLMHASGRFFKAAKSKAVEVIKDIEKGVEGAREVAVVTAEGFPVTVEVGQESASNLFRNIEKNGTKGGVGQRVVTKVNNMKEFFELDFGKKIAKFSEKTKHIYHGKPVYRINQKIGNTLKKGDYFYLDSLHCDHIEVFSKNGSIKTVLNLDGTVNLSKSKTALLENRVFKI